MRLSAGDSGSLVELLQLGLIRSGYLSGDIDGIYGPKTTKAVKDIQRAFSLEEDGIAGEKTFEVIKPFIRGYYKRTVKRGDTLWNISVMTGTPLNSILTANPDIDPNNLMIGEKITVPYPFPVVPTDISYSSYLTYLIIDGLKARYPFIILTSQGKSVMGKELYSLKIGKGNNSLFANAGFHSNEWLNIPALLKFTEDYLEAVSTGRKFFGLDPIDIYNSTAFHLMPLVNPDGLDLVTRALQSGEYYENAKNIAADFPFVPFPSGWKANINGVDLNLQYPAGWERAKEIKYAQGFTKPSPIEFVGFSPLSEPEAVAVERFTQKNDFNFILAFHSQGNIIYWKYLDLLPPDSERIGKLLSDASGYPLELTPPDSSYAGYKDWFISTFNKPGYTVETGKGTNPLPLTQFDSIYEAVSNMLAEALKITSSL